MTMEGQIAGTLQYMAPEQLQGKEADARSDIFSFGCVLYEMLSGATGVRGILGGQRDRGDSGAGAGAAEDDTAARSRHPDLSGEGPRSAVSECAGSEARSVVGGRKRTAVACATQSSDTVDCCGSDGA